MEDSSGRFEALLVRGAERLKGHQLRLFIAEVALETDDRLRGLVGLGDSSGVLSPYHSK